MTVRYTLELTPGDDPDIIAARLWTAGASGVQELPDVLVGWFDRRLQDVPPGGRWEAEPDRDWLATWRAGIGPTRIGRVLVVPSWLAEETERHDAPVVLELDPGIAFGSGQHATTRLCLQLLQDHLRPGDRVLDVGCGTGILAIAAALLGAGEVDAVDVDADAIHATRRNAERNGASVAAHLGGTDTLGGTGDLVLANLLTHTLQELAHELVALVRPGGLLVASGVAVERADGVVRALTDLGAALVEHHVADGWSALLLCRLPVDPA